MTKILEMIQNYWWVLAIAVPVLMYKWVFRLFGIIIVPEDKIGLVTKKFVLFGANRELPDGRIIATNGEAGYQAKTLAPGIYYGKWPWQYEIKLQGFSIIPEGHIGLIQAKDGSELPIGRILGTAVDCDNFQDAEQFLVNGGKKGRQTRFIPSGSYRINTYLFDISVVAQVSINENMVGIVTALDGEPIDDGQIAGKPVGAHNNFQDFDKFLTSGGQRGLQQQVILAGNYNLNPWAVQIEEIQMTEIPIAHCGVVISYVGQDGEDQSGAGFKHGNIYKKGYKGVWEEPLGPGKYAINRYTHKVELLPTANIVLNWATARTEAHKLDAGLSTITVRSKDGFSFNLDVSQIIHIPMNDAPKVIARFGNMVSLVSQVLEPTIGNYFRNSAQDSDVISFLTSRKERQESAKMHISKVLEEYNVHAIDTLIGDITPPESLMKTLTDRKIADEQQITFDTQKKAEVQRQLLEKESAIADSQREVVRAEQGVKIAEKEADASVKRSKGQAESIKLSAEADSASITMRANAKASEIDVTGKAEAGKIMAIGKSNAESYRLAVEAMGEENFTKYKVTESIGINKVKVIPDILITGGGNGDNGGTIMNGLMGMQLSDMLKKTKDSAETVKVVEEKKEEKK